jgi:hypothetical protein
MTLLWYGYKRRWLRINLFHFFMNKNYRMLRMDRIRDGGVEKGGFLLDCGCICNLRRRQGTPCLYNGKRAYPMV